MILKITNKYQKYLWHYIKKKKKNQSSGYSNAWKKSMVYPVIDVTMKATSNVWEVMLPVKNSRVF